MAVVASASLYRPLVIWSSNAWNLSSPSKLLIIAAGLFFVSILFVAGLRKTGLDPLAAAIGTATLLLVLLHWHNVAWIGPLPLFALILALTWISHSFRDLPSLSALAILLIASLGVAPVAQLVLAYLTESEPYPLAQLAPRNEAGNRQVVEDVVVVVIDGYPSLEFAHDKFGHVDDIAQELEKLGFIVAASAWTQHTDTSLALPSLLELRPVIDEIPDSWDNRTSLIRIMRGDNWVSSTLQTAGFTYHHIESGWDASSCGPTVDRCIQSPWVDEVVWQLLRPSVVGDWLTYRLGTWSTNGGLNAAKSFADLAEQVLDNGHSDYIFVHVLLPHPPFLLNHSCSIDPSLVERYLSPAPLRSADVHQVIAGQLECADRIIGNIASVVQHNTALLIVADHGTESLGQLGRAGYKWTNMEIAERMGVFMAYRFPPSGREPLDATNVEAMRALISCSVQTDLPTPRKGYLVGFDQESAWIAPERMEIIKALSAGE